MSRSTTSATPAPGPSDAPVVSAIVPTVGASPWILQCLRSLRREGGAELEIVVVDQGPSALRLPTELGVRRLRLEGNRGFAGGVNQGIAMARGELIATINDDLAVEPGWLAAARGALAADPGAAAVQGWVLSWQNPGRVDGCGLAFNRRWRAVQLGHGAELEALAGTSQILAGRVELGQPAGHGPEGPGPAAALEVFGVSATAALYRRSALEKVQLPNGDFFDERLGSYYEDVDLACRLRAAGYRALSLPMARALHAGSTTAGIARLHLVYGNRYPVLARLLGRSFWAQLPRIAASDLLDLLRAATRGRDAEAGAVLLGLGRALRLLPRFLRLGAPAVTMAELRRLRAETFSLEPEP